MTPLPLLVLEAGSGIKFLTNSNSLDLFGSYKELGGVLGMIFSKYFKICGNKTILI